MEVIEKKMIEKKICYPQFLYIESLTEGGEWYIPASPPAERGVVVGFPWANKNGICQKWGFWGFMI